MSKKPIASGSAITTELETLLETQLGVSISDLNVIADPEAIGFFDTLAFVDGDLSNGFFLSSGICPPDTNSSSSFSNAHGLPGDPDLDAVATSAFAGAGATEDAAIVEFTLNIDDPDVDGVAFDIVFGSDEFPEFSNTSFVDSAAVFVNGVNVALFNDDPTTPLSVIQPNIDQGNFIDNTDGSFPTEMDGFSQVLTIRTALQQGENTIKIGIADTGDQIYDSTMFVSNVNLLSDGAVTSGVLTVVDVEEDQAEVEATALQEEINLLVESQVSLLGLPENFNNDVITNFGDDDELTLLNVQFEIGDVTVTFGSAILDIDTDGDDVSDTTITLEGDFENTEFMVEDDGNGGTTITTNSNTNQTLIGTAAAETIDGEAGDDRIDGAGGDDTLIGGDGNDVLIDRDGNTDVSGDAGEDRVVLGSGNDTVDGGTERDVIKTAGGTDSVEGGEGDDVVLSGTENDTVDGGAGDDVIKSSTGDDSILGGDGNDVILSGDGDDSVFGGAGDDTIKPGRGNDQIYAGEGNDIVVGFRTDELIEGGDGDDTLLGNLGD
ncbi:MAG: choice-of-anchor L domain-containing protein, partial [Pseudomonadota bacterium]